MNRWDFLIFFLQEVYPQLGEFGEPNSIVVLDNAPIHHWDIFLAMCELLDVHILFLPSYSCDLNGPIEEFFRALKQNIKRMGASYRADQRQTILLNVDCLYDWDIFPICDRIGYTRFCNFR